MVTFVTVHAGYYGGQQVKSFSKDLKYSWFEEGFSTGFKSNIKAFTAEYRKSFGLHLLAYSVAASKVSLSNYYSFVSFELFCF